MLKFIVLPEPMTSFSQGMEELWVLKDNFFISESHFGIIFIFPLRAMVWHFAGLGPISAW